jgi:cell division protein FtsB
MTMDERLEKLAERQEALAQSVELLTAGVRELNRPSLSMKSA